jgi:hypothetical protein
MSRSRTNGVTGESIDLFAFFYNRNELTDPSSVGPVKIKYKNSLIKTIPASDIQDLGSGIRKISYAVDSTAIKGRYTDAWTDVIFDAGDVAESTVFEHSVRERDWKITTVFNPDRFRLTVRNDDVVKLNEKKYIKFAITDNRASLKNTDKVSLLLKDFNGSNVYVSDLTINQNLDAFYYFNSSKIKADYPTLINRESTYEWILKIEYKDQVFLPDPVQFNFSET